MFYSYIFYFCHRALLPSFVCFIEAKIGLTYAKPKHRHVFLDNFHSLQNEKITFLKWVRCVDDDALGFSYICIAIIRP